MERFKSKPIVLCLVFLMIASLFSSNAFATIIESPPKTHSWQYTYPDLNTTPDAQDAANKMTQIGYNGRYGTNYAAATVYDSMRYDAVFYHSGHSSPGRLLHYDGNNYSYISAQNGGTNSISNFSSTDINRMKLAVLDSCESALTHSTYGNLLEQLSYVSNNHGVDSSLGFTVILGQVGWGRYFWYHMQQGKTVRQAANDAAWDVQFYNNGNYHGYDRYSIAGSTSVTIKPAAYGSTSIP
ncbi:MAG: hypothetical protein ACOY35_08695 [Bacillota bacterium]